MAILPPILSKLQSMGYAVFTNGDFNLNLIGIRSAVRVANAFDDLIGCAYKAEDLWHVEWWEATTDPGVPYMIKPINNSGAAILCPGQYRGCWKIAKHRGQYDALCQVNGPVKVYRDDNRDNILDMDPDTAQTGMFGINIHKRSGDTNTVNGASAGCQVFRYQKAFDRMMDLAKMQQVKRGFDTFTYTLIDESDLTGQG